MMVGPGHSLVLALAVSLSQCLCCCSAIESWQKGAKLLPGAGLVCKEIQTLFPVHYWDTGFSVPGAAWAPPALQHPESLLSG